ncbi:wax ester synthase-like Acyl-CoA acyltransferase domain protein [Mycobacterium kansasii]|uniref:Wax ester synthase-like Acyl-CoA acyltransferase domain protein n=1 Tax=Mycobacterium kansasii TaxID=1768 RepID=A0A1V3X0K7_MYCKA|nr:wax ester synthase-like Acyl-CoA acyltransferase domain protein [Mycobacterium kansasii]
MELMSPVDALFLAAESREHPLHVGRCSCFSRLRAPAGHSCARPTGRCSNAKT